MKLYFSHSGKEDVKQVVELLSRSAEQSGFEVLGSDPSAGRNWQNNLEAALSKSDAVVFIVGPDSQDSPWLQREWSAALEQHWSHPDKPMIPVLVGDAKSPPFLRGQQSIGVSPHGNWLESAKTLIGFIQKRIAGVGGGSQASAETPKVERGRRLAEIAEVAAKLLPSDQEREATVESLKARIHELTRQDPPGPELPDLRLKLADELKHMGRSDEAVDQIRAALPLLEQRPELRRKLARAHLNLGRNLESLKLDPEAIHHLQTALALYKEFDGQDSLLVASINAGLSTLNNRTGNSVAAAAHREAARAGLMGLVGRVVGGLPILGPLLTNLFGNKGTAGVDPMRNPSEGRDTQATVGNKPGGEA